MFVDIEQKNSKTLLDVTEFIKMVSYKMNNQVICIFIQQCKHLENKIKEKYTIYNNIRHLTHS